MKNALYAVVLALLTMLTGAASAVADPPTGVVVADQAGVLDQHTLLPAVEKIEFYEPTKVAIFTYRGSSGDNLNEEVLRFARDKHPDWLSADGQKWADGLYVFALDPVGRHVGTYFGEDRKVSAGQRDDIQNATKELFREAQWTDGTIAGVERGAELINRPWYRSGGFILAVVIGGVGIIAGGGGWLAVRRKNRSKADRELKRGDASFTSVSMDLEVTELNAKTIPESSRYGSQVLEKYRGFTTKYRAAGALREEAHAFSRRDLSKKATVEKVTRYADAAVELDALDDVIADSNAFLNRYSGWDTAWDRQVAVLWADLDGIDALAAGKGSTTAAALTSFRDQTRKDLEAWAGALGAGTLSPDHALDHLQEAQKHLTDLLRRHSETVIDAYARNKSEATLMREDMDRSLRSGPAAAQPSILGTIYPAYTFYSVAAFSSAVSHGQGSINSARNAGAGGTTGYGSSGGSFSGSGSSSSF